MSIASNSFVRPMWPTGSWSWYESFGTGKLRSYRIVHGNITLCIKAFNFQQALAKLHTLANRVPHHV